MENQFKCSGVCLNCQPAQRQYCACQHAYSNMMVLDNIMTTLLAMQGDMNTLKAKIEAIQNNEATIFDPNAQEGDGAVKIDPQNSLT